MGFMPANISSSPIYKRGQIEWALWRAFAPTTMGRSKEVPSVFRTRIKRLLELDRSGDLFEMEVFPPAPFAFAESVSEGTGNDAAFSVFDAWCLGLALDLLDVGFKQKEVVFLMRFLRGGLADRFEKILNSPPGGRSNLHPQDRPGCPIYRSDRGEVADCHVFLIIRKVEIREGLPGQNEFKPHRSKANSEAPWFLEPIFCHGYDALRDQATRMPQRFRKAMVIEVAQFADDIRRFLEKAPDFRRGRQ
ncbi:hypothetical protein [Hyphomonas sp.]|uniref:hypothetical protein n=1 Tax=Alphaproteobacteria TaxID=28211 RepID=UPI0032639B05